MCLMCHSTDMKTVTIRDLHAATGKHVRAAVQESIVITERGKRIAILKSFSEAELDGVPFPRRRAASLPQVTGDSTAVISGDRDAR